MARQRKPKEKPFISIEEDVKPLGYSVHHEGMTKKAASKLVKAITELGLGIDADIVPKRGTGRMLDSRGYVPCCKQNAIESPRYLVRVTVEGRTMELENARQWELYKRLYLPAELAEEEDEYRDDGLEQMLVERIGMTIAEFNRFMSENDEEEEEDETDELTEVEEIPLSYVELLETALEEKGYESTWEAA